MYNSSNKAKPKSYLPNLLINMGLDYFYKSIFGEHSGVKRTLEKSCVIFYRPDLVRQMKDKVKYCEICTMAKRVQKNMKVLIATPASQPTEKLYMDIFGPLVRSKQCFNCMS